MSKMVTTYLGGGESETLNLKNGIKIMSDLSTQDGGEEKYFPATDLFAAALAICTTTMIGKMAENRGDNLKGLKTESEKFMAQDPLRVGKIILNITFPPGTSKEKIELYSQAAHMCPVHNSISPALDVEINIK